MAMEGYPSIPIVAHFAFEACNAHPPPRYIGPPGLSALRDES